MRLPATEVSKVKSREKWFAYLMAIGVPLMFFVVMFMADDPDRLIQKILALPLFLLLGAGALAIPLLVMSLLVS